MNNKLNLRVLLESTVPDSTIIASDKLSTTEASLLREVQALKGEIRTIKSAMSLVEQYLNEGKHLEDFKAELVENVLSPVSQTLKDTAATIENLQTTSEADKAELKKAMDAEKEELEKKVTEEATKRESVEKAFDEFLDLYEKGAKSTSDAISDMRDLLEESLADTASHADLEEIADKSVSILEDLFSKVKDLSSIIYKSIVDPGKMISEKDGTEEAAETTEKSDLEKQIDSIESSLAKLKGLVGEGLEALEDEAGEKKEEEVLPGPGVGAQVPQAAMQDLGAALPATPAPVAAPAATPTPAPAPAVEAPAAAEAKPEEKKEEPPKEEPKKEEVKEEPKKEVKKESEEVEKVEVKEDDSTDKTDKMAALLRLSKDASQEGAGETKIATEDLTEEDGEKEALPKPPEEKPSEEVAKKEEPFRGASPV